MRENTHSSEGRGGPRGEPGLAVEGCREPSGGRGGCGQLVGEVKEPRGKRPHCKGARGCWSAKLSGYLCAKMTLLLCNQGLQVGRPGVPSSSQGSHPSAAGYPALLGQPLSLEGSCSGLVVGLGPPARGPRGPGPKAHQAGGWASVSMGGGRAPFPEAPPAHTNTGELQLQ